MDLYKLMSKINTEEDEWLIPESFLTNNEEFLQVLIDKTEELASQAYVKDVVEQASVKDGENKEKLAENPMTDLSNIYEEFLKSKVEFTQEFWDNQNIKAGKLLEKFSEENRRIMYPPQNTVVSKCDDRKHAAYKKYDDDTFCKDCGKEL